MSDRIINQDVATAYVNEMARYAIADNLNRMIPQVKDGLKPVQRRLLFDMLEMGSISFKSKKKSARITGDTMGKYHPHADAYPALQTIENWWRCKAPLVKGHGNWGNFQGDGPASSRYTEVYVSQFSLDCGLTELKQHPEIVDWLPSYTGEFKEPDYLPFMVPILLINGANGVGTGMSMDLPKHNIHEVIEATRNVIKNPNAKVVLIPDFCMPCDIIEADWKSISSTGFGSFKARGIIEVGEYHKHPAVFIKSLPDRVYTSSIESKLQDMQSTGTINEIQDILDESTEFEMNLVIQLKKGKDPNYMKDVIYKYTDAEKSYRVDFEAIDGINPVRFSYKSYIEYFINMSKLTILRQYCAMAQDAKTAWHKIDAYIKVIESGELDNILRYIRKSASNDRMELINWLMKKLKITDLQAAFIVDTRLAKLSRGAVKQYKADMAQLEKDMNAYEEIILNDDKLGAVLDAKLVEIDKKYGAPRLCRVISKSDATDIPKGTFKIVITEGNYVRKLAEDDNVGTIRGDIPNYIIKAENDQNILVFSKKGKVFKLPVHKIPITDKNNSGTDIRVLCKGLTSDVTNIIYEPMVKVACDMKRKHFMVVTTACNSIKKLDLEDFLTVAPSGLTYTKLNGDDYVVDVSIAPDGTDLVVYSGHKALRMKLSDVPNYKRNTVGVLAMNTNDFISGTDVMYKDITHIVVVTKSGKVNKFAAVGLQTGKRYQAGNSIIKLGGKDHIVSVFGANDSNIIRIVSTNGNIDIPVSEIPTGSSISAGTKALQSKTDSIIKAKLM